MDRREPLAARSSPPPPDDDEVAALVVALAEILDPKESLEPRVEPSTSHWSRAARREALLGLGGGPRSGWGRQGRERHG